MLIIVEKKFSYPGPDPDQINLSLDPIRFISDSTRIRLNFRLDPDSIDFILDPEKDNFFPVHLILVHDVTFKTCMQYEK